MQTCTHGPVFWADQITWRLADRFHRTTFFRLSLSGTHETTHLHNPILIGLGHVRIRRRVAYGDLTHLGGIVVKGFPSSRVPAIRCPAWRENPAVPNAVGLVE